MNSSDFKSSINGIQTDLFILKNKNGLSAAFTNYGARWISFNVPDKNGTIDDIVLGFNSLQEYLKAEEKYHGAIIGRIAGRIKRAGFNLNNKQIELSINEKFPDGSYGHLHGGIQSFSFRVWEGTKNINERGEEMVSFHLLSPAKEEGYPGNLKVEVTYTLSNNNSVKIEYNASSDKLTPLCLTNHAYFNLNGRSGHDVLNHYLQINGSEFLEMDPIDFSVTGKIIEVKNTPLDFNKMKKIGADINVRYYQIIEGRGYNSYFILTQNAAFYSAAILKSEESGRSLEILTTEPGLQLYCGGYWTGQDFGKGGLPYRKYGGVALELQQYPDAVNNRHFPTILLEPNQKYYQLTEYRFRLSTI